MNLSRHTLHELFDQLGLQSNDEAVIEFIQSHRPLTQVQKLESAPFWNPAQAAFLREAIEDDADWSMTVDELDALLRH